MHKEFIENEIWDARKNIAVPFEFGQNKVFVIFIHFYLYCKRAIIEIDILQCCILDHIIYKITKHEIAKVGKPVCNG